VIGKLARKLGFEQTVPASVVADWQITYPSRPVIEIAPRHGTAGCFVDQYGRIQVDGESWSLELTLAAGARWIAGSESPRVRQTVINPGVVETIIATPSGSVMQRVAAGVVDGEPAAIVEIENTTGVAIAAGVVARPLTLSGRGFVAEATVDANGLFVEGRRGVRFQRSPASVAATMLTTPRPMRRSRVSQDQRRLRPCGRSLTPQHLRS